MSIWTPSLASCALWSAAAMATSLPRLHPTRRDRADLTALESPLATIPISAKTKEVRTISFLFSFLEICLDYSSEWWNGTSRILFDIYASSFLSYNLSTNLFRGVHRWREAKEISLEFSIISSFVRSFVRPMPSIRFQLCAPTVPTMTARSRTRCRCCPVRVPRAAAVPGTNRLRPPCTRVPSSNLTNSWVSFPHFSTRKYVVVF